MKNRVLIFELNWLGDILFSFPLLRALKGSGKCSYIACAVVPRYKGLLEDNPWIDEVMDLPDDRGLRAFFRKIVFFIKVRRKGLNVCFLLKPSRTKSLIAFLSGIKKRIGFEGKRSLLTDRVDMPEKKIHRADQLLSLAEVMGVKADRKDYRFDVTAQDLDDARVLLERSGVRESYIAIHPGGNWEAKRWPEERFADLIEKILDSYGDIDVVITGASKDIELAEYLCVSDRVFSLTGKTTLRALGAIFKGSRLVISADSGPMHLASAVGASLVALFGPTSSEMTGPIGDNNEVVIYHPVSCEIPCYVEKCVKGRECMNTITVDEVFEAVRKVVDEKRS